MNKLFLFDIDGTLIRTNGAGKRSFIKAFEDLYGYNNAFENISMHGMLDPIIYENALIKYGIRTNNFTDFKEKYLNYLKEETKNTSNWKCVEGIKHFLQKHSSNNFFVLLTGNIFEGAKLKLSAMDLWQYFPSPEIGAFGDNAKERIFLGDIALKKIKDHKGLEFNLNDIYVFGDTPHDINVAKYIRAKSIALTSGGIERKELEKYNPNLIVNDFTEIDDNFFNDI